MLCRENGRHTGSRSVCGSQSSCEKDAGIEGLRAGAEEFIHTRGETGDQLRGGGRPPAGCHRVFDIFYQLWTAAALAFLPLPIFFFFFISPLPAMPADHEQVPTTSSHMMKTTKRGRPFLKVRRRKPRRPRAPAHPHRPPGHLGPLRYISSIARARAEQAVLQDLP